MIPMRLVLGNCGVAVAYALAGLGTSAFLSPYGFFPSPFWPPAGIGLTAALVGGTRLWPGIFAGAFYVNWTVFDEPLWLALGTTSAVNVAAPILGSTLIRWTTHSRIPFYRFRHVVCFTVFGAIVPSCLAASAGVALAVKAGLVTVAGIDSAWWRWTLSEAGGTFLLAPPLILWWGDRRRQRLPGNPWEAAVVSAATLMFTLIVFLGIRGPAHPFQGIPYLLFAPILWLTVRFSLHIATPLLSAVALVAIGGTLLQHGPFHLAGNTQPLFGLGMLVVALSCTTLAVGALVSERQAAEDKLREMNETLEEKVAQRTTELHRRATRDGLTEVCNRAYFFEQGNRILKEAQSSGQPLAALMIDVDYLKAINDRHGHHMGDAAILRIANACRASVRDSDLVGRIGGDEFAALLQDTEAGGALAVRARIERVLQSASLPDVTVGASIGIAVLTDADTQLSDLLNRADAAMYAEKQRRHAQRTAD